LLPFAKREQTGRRRFAFRDNRSLGGSRQDGFCGCNRLGRTGGTALTTAIVLSLLAIMAALGIGLIRSQSSGEDHGETVESSTDVTRNNRFASQSTGSTFAIHIRPGPPVPTVKLAPNRPDGMPVSASCGTCHATRKVDRTNRFSTDLTDFHQQIKVQHGALTCLSCHNENNYDQLKLADATAVEYPDVMQLCAQCHGPQMTDFQHGAHGGMTGHWDLSRGPRERNNCVDCHHPHEPAFPAMQPTFKPIDRFLSPRPPHSNSRKVSHE